MSDDLITRGREIFNRGLPEDVRRFGREVADEIERLRATVQRLDDLTRAQDAAQDAMEDAGVKLRQRAEEAEAEADHFNKLAHVDLGANPPVSWRFRCEAAEAKVRKLREFITQVEWSEDPINKENYCCWCGRWEKDGHSPVCPHQRALTMPTEPAKPSPKPRSRAMTDREKTESLVTYLDDGTPVVERKNIREICPNCRNPMVGSGDLVCCVSCGLYVNLAR